jgi:hypothetical protein
MTPRRFVPCSVGVAAIACVAAPAHAFSISVASDSLALSLAMSKPQATSWVYEKTFRHMGFGAAKAANADSPAGQKQMAAD